MGAVRIGSSEHHDGEGLSDLPCKSSSVWSPTTFTCKQKHTACETNKQMELEVSEQLQRYSLLDMRNIMG